jgi:hypothetical protein
MHIDPEIKTVQRTFFAASEHTQTRRPFRDRHAVGRRCPPASLPASSASNSLVKVSGFEPVKAVGHRLNDFAARKHVFPATMKSLPMRCPAQGLQAGPVNATSWPSRGRMSN